VFHRCSFHQDSVVISSSILCESDRNRQRKSWPVWRYRVASSAAACASLRRNRCTTSTALVSWRPGGKRAVAVAERNLCRPRRCQTGAGRRGCRGPPRVESGPKERRNRVAVRVHTYTTHKRGEIFAEIHISRRKFVAHREWISRKNSFFCTFYVFANTCN